MPPWPKRPTTAAPPIRPTGPPALEVGGLRVPQGSQPHDRPARARLGALRACQGNVSSRSRRGPRPGVAAPSARGLAPALSRRRERRGTPHARFPSAERFNPPQRFKRSAFTPFPTAVTENAEPFFAPAPTRSAIMPQTCGKSGRLRSGRHRARLRKLSLSRCQLVAAPKNRRRAVRFFFSRPDGAGAAKEKNCGSKG